MVVMYLREAEPLLSPVKSAPVLLQSFHSTVHNLLASLQHDSIVPPGWPGNPAVSAAAVLGQGVHRDPRPPPEGFTDTAGGLPANRGHCSTDEGRATAECSAT